MKNKPNFFFDNRGFPNWGGGGGGSAAWEFFPLNPVFFLITSLTGPDNHFLDFRPLIIECRLVSIDLDFRLVFSAKDSFKILRIVTVSKSSQTRDLPDFPY